MNKRGISGVITTLLLITVSIVAVAIIAVVIINLTQKSSETDVLSVFSDAEIISVDIDESNYAMVKLKRLPGAGKVNGIRFIFKNESGEEFVYDDNEEIKEDMIAEIERLNSL